RRLVVEVGPRVLPRREVELVEIREVGRRDQPAVARRTPEVAVVHAHEVAVGGQPDVALEAVRAVVERGDVRAQRVLGVVVAGTAVGDDLWSHRGRCSTSPTRLPSVSRTNACHSSVPAGPRVSSSCPKITCGSDSTYSRSRPTVASMSSTRREVVAGALRVLGVRRTPPRSEKAE